MKKYIDVALVLGGVSFLLGLISRIWFAPWILGLEARSFLGFTEACLLFAIALGIRELLKK